MPSIKNKKAPFKNPFGSGFTGSRAAAFAKRRKEVQEMGKESKEKSKDDDDKPKKKKKEKK